MTAFSGIDRRSLLQHAFAVAGVTLMPGAGEALAKAAKSAKRQLDPANYTLLTAVADTIVPKTDTPGAVDVGVPRLLDALLGSWASPTTRADMTAALATIDKLAITQHKTGFAKLTPAQRHAVLLPHDVAALKPVTAAGVQATSPLPSSPTVADPKQGKTKQAPTLAQRYGAPVHTDPGYAKLKELVVVLYYYSEPALTHELPYEHAPGEWRPSTPVTPSTRPYGGAAFM